MHDCFSFQFLHGQFKPETYFIHKTKKHLVIKISHFFAGTIGSEGTELIGICPTSGKTYLEIFKQEIKCFKVVKPV